MLARIYITIFILFGILGFVSSAQAELASASYQGKAFCPKGTHFSLRNGGECWSCPYGYKRTLKKIAGPKACKRKSYTEYKRARKGKQASKKKQCTGKWFYKRRDGGNCWTCGTYKRTLHPLKSAKACKRKFPKSERPATYVTDFGCGRGQSFSLRKGGTCWSCPSGFFRTVAKVNGPKACTNNAKEIFAIEQGGVCRTVINGLVKGGDAMGAAGNKLQKIAGPLLKPVNKALGKVTSLVSTPKKLEELLQKSLAKLEKQPKALRALQSLSAQANRHRPQLQAMFRDADLVCNNKGRGLIRKFQDVGIFPTKKASLFDGLFIKKAYANDVEESIYGASISGFIPKVGKPFGYLVTLTAVTNGRESRIYMSIGLEYSQPASDKFSRTISLYYFPKGIMRKMGGFGQLGLETQISANGKFQRYLKSASDKYPKSAATLKLLPKGFSIVQSPLDLVSVPGFGVIVDEAEFDPKPGTNTMSASGSVDVSIRLSKTK